MVISNERHRGTLDNAVINRFKRLRLAHILVHTLTAPGGVADDRCPVVVILTGPPDVHHIVDQRTSAESFASYDVVDFVFVVFLVIR